MNICKSICGLAPWALRLLYVSRPCGVAAPGLVLPPCGVVPPGMGMFGMPHPCCAPPCTLALYALALASCAETPQYVPVLVVLVVLELKVVPILLVAVVVVVLLYVGSSSRGSCSSSRCILVVVVVVGVVALV
jgi:hypothetical protein